MEFIMEELKQYKPALTVEDICEILSISKPTAYELMDSEGFPLFRIGRSKRVLKNKFVKWLDEKQTC